MKRIILKKNEDRRIVAGHPWVFSNEVRETQGDPAIGDVVELIAASGLSLGVGLYNPHSLICVRLLSNRIEEIDAQFFLNRITQALALRTVLYRGQTAYRLVHGEGDFLPGLIVDRFNDYIAVQTLSYGMDARLPFLCDALEELLHPAGIIERNESPLRQLENLPLRKNVVRGTTGSTLIDETGLQFAVDPMEGQKTGFFFDQRENRLGIRRFSEGIHVLDCFCNDGGFALNAARGGAASVLGIDSSAGAIRRAEQNALVNRCDGVRFEQADVFERIESLATEERQFGLIILDPPSFTKSRKNVTTAKKGYRELHAKALRLLTRGGILATASCSHHIEPEVFLDLVDQSARGAGRQLQLLEWKGAAPDHPSLPASSETRYLKFGVFRVL
jgi:23S rRNA (cytosine1962-C5)-methyltransferase